MKCIRNLKDKRSNPAKVGICFLGTWQMDKPNKTVLKLLVDKNGENSEKPMFAGLASITGSGKLNV